MRGQFTRRLWAFNEGGEAGSTGGAGGSDPSTTVSTSPDKDGADGTSTTFVLGDTPPPPTDGQKAFENLIPDDYRNKAYIQNLLKNDDPTTELFKQFDGLQSKLGQRVEGVPKDDASQEEWDKFYNSLGRPEAPDKYEFQRPEISDEDKPYAEALNSMRDEAFEGKIKELFHKNGISAKQAAALSAGYEQLFMEANKEQVAALMEQQKAQDEGFAKLAEETWGKDTDRNLERANKIINEFGSDKFKAAREAATNEQLIFLADVVLNMHDKLAGEDKMTGRGNATGGDNASERKRAIELAEQRKKEDPMSAKYHLLTKEINEIYQNLS